VKYAAWDHVGERRGVEVVSFDGTRFEGNAAFIDAWVLRYVIELDDHWRTITAEITNWLSATRLEHDGDGHWQVDGTHVPELDGCLDVDLESSALTNAFPVNRLNLEVGERAEAPAAYVRAGDLRVERLEQQYVRLDDTRYHYSAPRFDFECDLVYDEAGLVSDYPGIATRVG